MKKASLRQRWRDEQTTIGAWCFHPDELTAEFAAKAGFDYIGIDMQHGPIDFTQAVNMIRGIDLGDAVPLVRLPWNDPAIIGQVLDAGAMAIVVPMVNSAEDAAAAVRAARYGPAGERSFGPIRAELRDGPSYPDTANDDIVAVDGVDAVYVGVWDLSLALGLAAGDNDGDPVFDTVSDLASCGAVVLGGNPVNAIAWLANKLWEIGEITFEPGHTILSGSFLLLKFAKPGDHFVARFDSGFGDVELTFD